MVKRRSRLPDGVEQLCLFPGDVAIRPRRAPGRSAPPSCAETGHTWARGQQMRLFGLPPERIVYCSRCGKLYR
ncbi:MAG TPA: hypothetical protein VFV38_00200 [Ktedonobacteraceae bacterium]|nr:hypothetical protein [Ktedonobacteraceae bacterium]